MKIFVTGGTGFIGSHFLNHALRSGHEVVALRRSPHSAPAVGLIIEPKWLTKPLEDLSSDDFKGVDVLIHLAAHGVSPQPAEWSGCFEFNLTASIKMAQTAFDAGVPRLVASGTYAEYGLSGLRFDHIPSNAPLEPIEPYAASKAASGMALAAFARNQNWKFYYGRIFSAYGEGQFENNFWPQLRDAARRGEDFPMTPGEQVRDFLSVERVAEIFLEAAVGRELLKGEPVIENVASGEPITLKDFAMKWWNLWGAKGELKVGEVEYRDDEVMTYIPQVP